MSKQTIKTHNTFAPRTTSQTDQSPETVMATYASVQEGLVAAQAVASRAARDEALAILAKLREQFPDEPEPVFTAVRLHKEGKQFEQCELILRQVQARFTGHLGFYINWAWLAHERGDFGAAIERWAETRERFSDHPAGYHGAAVSLRKSGRLDEAEALIASAIERFPDEFGIAAEYAEVSAARRNFDEAVARWERVIEKFPDQPGAYLGASLTLREFGRFEEAEATLRTALARLLNDTRIVVDFAWLAQLRHDWPEAARRWGEVRRRVPDHEGAFIMGAGALRAIGEAAEAEVVLAQAVTRFPNAPEPLLDHARIALEREDWEEAARRFTQAAKTFPAVSAAYVGLAHALSRSRSFNEAEAVLREAMTRFSGEAAPFAEYGMVAIRRNDWKVALERALDAQHRFPNDAGINQRVFEARMRVAESDPAAISGDDPSDAAAIVTDDPRTLMMRFESLGGSGHGCEFGIVQRHFGAEPLGLLRWADLGSDAEGLIRALDTELAGIGEPAHTELITLPTGGRMEYWTRDRRYWMAMRAFIFEDEIPYQKMYAQACRRLQYLRRKLTEDLREGSKIFVYKNMFRDLTDVELSRLHAAVGGYGENTLLYVRFADAGHPSGSVEAAVPGLLVGYIDHFAFSPKNEPQGNATTSWLALCRKALRVQSGIESAELSRQPASVS